MRDFGMMLLAVCTAVVSLALVLFVAFWFIVLPELSPY